MERIFDSCLSFLNDDDEGQPLFYFLYVLIQRTVNTVYINIVFKMGV